MKSIPLPHNGPENPVAHDTQSEVPQEPVKQERVKKEPPPPKNAVELKSKTAKQLRAKVRRSRRCSHFKSFDELDPNKIKSQAGARGFESDVFRDARRGADRHRREHHAGFALRRILGSGFSNWSRSIGARAMSMPASGPRLR